MAKKIEINSARVEKDSLGASLVFAKVGIGSLSIIRHIVSNNEVAGHKTIIISDDSSSYSGSEVGSCIQYSFLDFADNLYSWGRRCSNRINMEKLEINQIEISPEDRLIIRISYDVVENLDYLPAFISCLRVKLREELQISDDRVLFWLDDAYCQKETMKYNDDLTFYQVKRKNTQDISFEKVGK